MAMDAAAGGGALVLDTLRQACSQEANVLKPAEQQLKEWETQPGFYSILSSIFSEHSIEVNVRWLAVLYFKNGVDKYWRKSAPNAISEDEKQQLRQKLIADFNEPVSQIAIQIAVLIAKVARLDVPGNWQELIPTLLQAIRCEEEIRCQRALLTLHHVTKTLASKRLSKDKKLFEELTQNVFGFVMTLWNGHTERFLQGVSAGLHADLPKIHSAFDHSLLALKVLRKMLAFGFNIKTPDKSEEAISFVKMVFERLHTLVQAKKQLHHLDVNLLPRREKAVNLLTKVLLDAQQIHPDAYIQFLQPTLELAVRYSFTEAGHGLLYERFTVNCFSLMKNIMVCENYRPPKHVEGLEQENGNQVILQAHKIKMSFFTYETLAEILKRLISHYFLLTTDDLNCWDSDPEGFVTDEGGDSWKFSLRPSTEVLFLTLIKEFRSTLTPVLLDMVREIQAPTDAADLPALLRKDAVYNAVGLASFDLFDEVDFDQWFTSHLLAELSNQHPNNRIVRRRVIWLVGQWVGVKMAVELRPAVYEAILPLLRQEEDLVVRIEAASALNYAVDDFEFRTEQFLPYLDRIFGLLFQLLKEVTECETKMLVLHVMSFVIERVGVQIRPHASALLLYLPSLWHDSEEHNMLRCAILTTLIHLIQGFGNQSVNMYEFLLPVIQCSTDVNQDQHVYLLEDGLELWHMMLQHSPAPLKPQILQLYDNMPPLLELGSDYLRTCLKIIDCYLLLGPKEFMQSYSNSLMQSLTSLLTDLKTDGIVMIMKLVELVFRTFPVEGPEVFQQMLPPIFEAILESDEYPMVMAMYLSLFGRILLQHPQFFWQFIDRAVTEMQRDIGDLVGKLMDVWFDRVDNITQTERRKLSALALASLLSSDLPAVQQRFGSIINVCVEVLHDVCRMEGDSQIDCLVMKGTYEVSEDELDTEHDKRMRALALQDPVHQVALKDFVMSQLTLTQQKHGQSGFSQLMGLIDPTIANELETFLKTP